MNDRGETSRQRAAEEFARAYGWRLETEEPGHFFFWERGWPEPVELPRTDATTHRHFAFIGFLVKVLGDGWHVSICDTANDPPHGYRLESGGA